MKAVCVNGMTQEVWMINNKGVCTATHPKQPNFSGHSRGRKIHLAKDDKMTVCNMLIDKFIPRSDKTWTMVNNGKCKNCFI